MKYMILIIIFHSFLLFSGEEMRTVDYSYVLSTDFPDKTIEAVRQLTAETNGFVLYFDGSKITMRIPSTKAEEIISFLEKNAFIQDRYLNSQDVSDELLQLKATLNSKEELYVKVTDVFKNSGFSNTLRLEQELFYIITEIERLKGQIRVIENRMAMSMFTVQVNPFTSDIRNIPTHTSRWEWINNLSVESLRTR